MQTPTGVPSTANTSLQPDNALTITWRSMSGRSPFTRARFWRDDTFFRSHQMTQIVFCFKLRGRVVPFFRILEWHLRKCVFRARIALVPRSNFMPVFWPSEMFRSRNSLRQYSLPECCNNLIDIRIDNQVEFLPIRGR